MKNTRKAALDREIRLLMRNLVGFRAEVGWAWQVVRNSAGFKGSCLTWYNIP
jgi:hypothetical protein